MITQSTINTLRHKREVAQLTGQEVLRIEIDREIQRVQKIYIIQERTRKSIINKLIDKLYQNDLPFTWPEQDPGYIDEFPEM